MSSKHPPPLFKPFRALGYITDSVPFAVQRRGKETFVTVSVGRTWQIYNCNKLTLVMVGPQLAGSIRCLAAKSDLTFAGVGHDVVECKRMHRHGIYRSPPLPTTPLSSSHKVLSLLVMGDVLLSLEAWQGKGGQGGGRVVVWRIGQHEEPMNVVPLPDGLTPTCMAHVDTYLNKVVVGCTTGQLVLLNFVTGATLYTFGSFGSAVRSVASSPALDVVGLAMADGRAVLHNLKFDETVASFANAAGVGLGGDTLVGGAEGAPQVPVGGNVGGGAGCTSLSFRTGAGVPLMAAGGGAGVITVWNLEEKRLHAVVKDAHDAPVVCLHFFAGEPLLMSSGADNALKHWVFDNMADAAPRLLRFRSGHAAPPTVVAHYGEGGLRLLAAGSDRAFRVFSTIQDQQSRELSQKHVGRKAKKLKVKEADLKLGKVVALDAGTVRERDWCNVITAHEGESAAFVWRLQHFTLGEHELRPPVPMANPSASGRNAPDPVQLEELTGGRLNTNATAVCLSPCGNFGMVGSASGRLDRYNMQSGYHRGCYGRQPPGLSAPPGMLPMGVKPLKCAHEGAIVGVAVDSCNRLMVSCGLDKMLRIWDFKAMKLLHEIQLPSTPCRMALHSSSCLLAVASGDTHGITVYDVEANGRLVRRFNGHEDRITSLHLSADCRWLLSSSMDGTMRVWDVPAAQCLQVLRLGPPITCLSLSPTLDMLATTHINRRGIYLWANQAVFSDPSQFVHSSRPVDVSLPTVSASLSEQQQQQQQQDALTGKKRGRGSTGGVTIAGMEPANESSGSSSEESDSENEARAAGRSTGAAPMEEGGSSDEDEGYGGMEGGASSSSSSGSDEEGEEGSVRVWGSQQRHNPVTGAPEPIAPEMVTLSLLPRAQWQSLVHLEAIKARNKPLQPPKKPEAAPFFLPTTPSLAPNPVFTSLEEQQQQAAAQQQEELDQAIALGNKEAAEELSRVMNTLKAERAGLKGSAPGGLTTFVWLLRAGADAGDYASFMAHARGLSAAALDREVRALQILASAEEDEIEAAGVAGSGSGARAEALRDVAALLDCLDRQLTAGTNFEFCQALLQLMLQVHGDAIVQQPLLRSTAQRLLGHLKPVWRRLDGLMQDVRCMVGYFGNLQ